jgi:type IV pilus assembly protein PilC
MARYFYTAISQKGEEESGFLEAKDVFQLAQILRQKNLILVRAESEEREVRKKFELPLPSLGISLAEKLFFTRNLQVMIAAALPLPKAIESLASQAKSKKFRNVLLEIKEEIQRGKSFSESISKYPNVFSELYHSMIEVGEESGTLEEVLKVLTLQMERAYDLRSKIKGAMMYPAVVVAAMIGIGILMMMTVVPQLAATFKELNVDLPATTKFIIFLAEFFRVKWYLLILIIVFLLFFFQMALKNKAIKKILDIISLKVPIISPILKKTNSAYTARNLSSLISAGVPIVRSLEITSRTLGNLQYKKALMEGMEKVSKGEKLSGALLPYKNIYPLTLIQMIEVGEETGQTATVLAKLADFYEDEVTDATKNLSSLIEPILILIIGAVVGFFAVSMIQPLYSMLGAIQ